MAFKLRHILFVLMVLVTGFFAYRNLSAVNSEIVISNADEMAKVEMMQDSDNDKIFDEAELEIWGTDPNNGNTDADEYADYMEIKSGYSPVDSKPVIINANKLAIKFNAEKNLENDIKENEGRLFYKTSSGEEYNFFEQDENLFRFEYKNHLVVKVNRGVYFLENIANKEVIFQIFEETDDMVFEKNDYQCESYSGENQDFLRKTICFSKYNPDNAIINLEIFGRKDKFARIEMAKVSAKSALKYNYEVNKSDFFTRAEALELGLTLAYPEKDFSTYAGNCFKDVNKNHPLSGYICYAKDNGIVIGIENSFYPENSVNLFGLLKILFKTHDIEDMEFDESMIDLSVFEQMQTIHYAYPQIGKALYEGLFDNITNKSLWSNQSVSKGEIIHITYNFINWINGRKMRNYDISSVDNPANAIYIKEENPIYNFKEKNEIDLEKKYEVNTKIVDNKNIYIEDNGNVLFLVMTTEDKITNVKAFYNKDKLDIEMEVELKNGNKKTYGLDTSDDQFAFLKDEYFKNGFPAIKDKLDDMGLLPNSVAYPKNNSIPKIKIYMDDKDFESIYIHRTANWRYRAYMEMTYPNGEVVSKSILIKTRGNANRGYIKSSYTIEAFSDFKDEESYEGDEFLKGNDEFKLRSFINDETLIHEKLYYDAFAKLGNIAPEFFEVTVDINGIPMGLYQATEPVKKSFFKERNISTDNYFYAQNSGSELNTNLKYYDDDATTLAQYDVSGNPNKLINFILDLEVDDEDLIWELNKENIFDYAMFTYLTNSSDALTHNYYVYLDDSTNKWNIFPWDADLSFEDVPAYSRYDFLTYTKKDEDTFNNLIRYLFNNLDTTEKTFYIENFKKKWNNKVDLIGLIESYEEKYNDYFVYENELWNGKHIERINYEFDTPSAIKDLKKEINKLNSNLNWEPDGE
ncbi:CotH kinase family protein [Candidatus Peregrinibacteria bacterium]|nr:CotH kinase family protein [Candidatus Peregrinibacteria bacterium]